MSVQGVPRSIRLVNLLAALLFVAGAGVYIWAWLGMRALESYVTAPDAAAFAGTARFSHYVELYYIGFWLVGAAVAVAVASAIAALVVQRRATPPAS